VTILTYRTAAAAHDGGIKVVLAMPERPTR